MQRVVVCTKRKVLFRTRLSGMIDAYELVKYLYIFCPLSTRSRRNSIGIGKNAKTEVPRWLVLPVRMNLVECPLLISIVNVARHQR